MDTARGQTQKGRPQPGLADGRGDATPSLDAATAREIAVQLAEYDVLWLEEPLAGTDLTALAALRASGGEMTRTFALSGRPPWRPTRSTSTSRTSCWPQACSTVRADRRARPGAWPAGTLHKLDLTDIGLPARPAGRGWGRGGPFIEFPVPPSRMEVRSGATSRPPRGPGPDGVLRVPTTPGLRGCPRRNRTEEVRSMTTEAPKPTTEDSDRPCGRDHATDRSACRSISSCPIAWQKSTRCSTSCRAGGSRSLSRSGPAWSTGATQSSTPRPPARNSANRSTS